VIGYAVDVTGWTSIAPLAALVYPTVLLGGAAYIAHARAPAVRAIRTAS
jgi:hypothetical protein